MEKNKEEAPLATKIGTRDGMWDEEVPL